MPDRRRCVVGYGEASGQCLDERPRREYFEAVGCGASFGLEAHDGPTRLPMVLVQITKAFEAPVARLSDKELVGLEALGTIRDRHLEVKRGTRR